MSNTSAYKIRIRTDSDDSNGLLLLDGSELVAILVELADESHGDGRGQWIIEATFGLSPVGQPGPFKRAEDAAHWVSRNICHQPFFLNGDVTELL